MAEEKEITTDGKAVKVGEEEIDIEELREYFRKIMADKEIINFADRISRKADKELGIIALEGEDSYDPNEDLECIIHYMRYDQSYLFDCGIQELHSYEMCLSAHIAFVKAKESYWGIMCDIRKREMVRALKRLAHRCPGKTVAEREAVAIEKCPELRHEEKLCDAYSMYREKCRGLTEVLIQMDNSLKKTLELRRNEARVLAERKPA